ncbi:MULTISPECIES: amino-acid N-acetyltransferase [Corallincola]|uniref:amino-acid N-acetyltransferase n=1 Tax=Corallincola TaxID=1775176 RepID=UPI0013EE44FB|nr:MULTISPECIES: amino-acid N-acetyltransferase [Corallincola]
MRTTDLVDGFRHSSPYVNAHRGKTFVIMLGGEAIKHENFRNIINDISLLNTLGIRIVLVYGARPQIDEALTKAKIACEYHQHTRITDADSLDVISGVAGSLQLQIMARLSMSLANTPMQGTQINVVSGNFVIAQPLGVIDGIDFCHSGKVRRIDVAGINRQLDQNSIVIHGPVAASVTGESFNLTAEEVATQIAIRIKADKVIGFCADQGLLDPDGQVIAELMPSEAEALLQSYDDGKANCSAAKPFLLAAIKACRSGVPRCHLISGEVDGAILQELFSREGIGTQVVTEPAEQVRQARIDDIGGILNLIRPLEKQGILVRRSREQLEVEIDRFTISERDGLVVACAALYPFEDSHVGELACLAVDPEYRSADRGTELVRMIQQKAKRMGIETLFALTTHSIHWFLEHGFVPADVSDLPPQKQQMYNLQRRSKILKMEI